jgi:hypothetical protein
MKSKKQLTTTRVALSILLTISICSTSFAYGPPNQQYESTNIFADIFKDSLYGGAVGALVGGALAVLTQQPGKHLDRIGYGAAIGVLGGTAFAVANAARHSAFAEIEDKKVKFAIPTIQPNVEKDDHHPSIVTANANFFALKF